MKKSPSTLVSSDKLNDTQRKSIGAGKYEPRIREANEALPITFRVSKLTSIPIMEPARPGANDFLRVKRLGVNC
jgi:hypothetical protein